MLKFETNRLTGVLVVVVSAFVLMAPAFLNGFPIVYSDTSTYIVSGFELETPFDRPIIYGVFLWLSSLAGISLWLTVLVQCLLLAWLIHLSIHRFLDFGSRTNLVTLLVILFLSLFTSVSWTASQLMPDIFTSIMLLSSILVLSTNRKCGLRPLIGLYIIFFVSAAMHMGHLSFNVGFLVAILVLRKLKFAQLQKLIPLAPVLILLTLSLATILTMGSAFAKSRNPFFMGALVEHGIAKKYLDQNCEFTQYKMCIYKDSLPKYAWEFLWEMESPFYKMGAWTETREEFGEIIRGTLTSPEFIGMHLRESVKATAEQIVKFKIGDGNGSFLNGTLLHERIAHYFPQELSEYENSKQSLDQLFFIETANMIIAFVVIVAFGLSCLLATMKIQGFNKLFTLILLGVIVNAWVCGTFANAIDRLGSKLIWLVPLLAIIGLLKFWQTKSRVSQTNIPHIVSRSDNF